MTRIFTDGAEMGDAQFWDYNNPTTPINAVSVPAPMGGTYSYRGAYLSASKTISALSEFYIRYRLRTDNISHTSGAQILGFRFGGTTLGYFTVDAIGRFCVIVGATTVATSAITMQNDTWYLIEIHYKVDDINGIFNVYLDGTEIINFSGDTKPGTDTTIDNICFNSSAYVNVYVDDLALNDTAGGSDDGWCGDGIVVKMTPDGNGTDNDWHGSDGDDVNNYLLVDEFPNDGDLTYVYRDGADSGVQDQYTLTDLDYTNKVVLRIYPEARARKTSAEAYTLKLGILPSGGVDNVSAGRTLFTNVYSRIVGNEYTVNPVDSLAWEEADLDAIEFIAEVG